MTQKTKHQALKAMTVEEFEADPPKAIRPLPPIVECAECERLRAENAALTKDLSGSAVRNINLRIYLRGMADLRAENYELKSHLITLAGRLEYISDHTDWTRAELLEWIKEIDALVGGDE